MKLTDLTIRRASIEAKAYTLCDGAGLYLNIKSNGTKQWLYRFYWEGIQKRISLGLYPTINLKKARSLRQQAQDMLINGIDPRTGRKSSSKTSYIQEKNQVAPVITFAQYADIWKAFKFKKPLDQITRSHVLAVQRKIERRGALSIAEKVRSWLNEIFRYAMAEGLIDHNPAGDLNIVALPQRPTLHNPFLKMSELPAFLHTLKNYQGSKQTQLGIQLLFLTGVRTGELRQATKEQIDLPNSLWKIPAQNVKQLQKLVRSQHEEIPPYIVPLPQPAIAIIKELQTYQARGQKYLLSTIVTPADTSAKTPSTVA